MTTEEAEVITLESDVIDTDILVTELLVVDVADVVDAVDVANGVVATVVALPSYLRLS